MWNGLWQWETTGHPAWLWRKCWWIFANTFFFFLITYLLELYDCGNVCLVLYTFKFFFHANHLLDSLELLIPLWTQRQCYSHWHIEKCLANIDLKVCICISLHNFDIYFLTFSIHDLKIILRVVINNYVYSVKDLKNNHDDIIVPGDLLSPHVWILDFKEEVIMRQETDLERI